MLIYTVDDEENVLEESADIIKEVKPDAEILTFTRGAAALEKIAGGDRPDVVFSDIEMPGISGLEFAVKLKSASPDTRIIFLTGYEKYALEAFRLKVHGYLLKPLTKERVEEELKYVPQKQTVPAGKLSVKCFGHFDVFYDNKPVIFMRKQSKELFAYLIFRNGASCTSEEIALALWDEGSSRSSELMRIRRIISDLKASLKQIDMEKVLIREHRQLAINRDMIDCDYFRMLDGDTDAVNGFRGDFMPEYSWAEIINARLHFRR